MGSSGSAVKDGGEQDFNVFALELLDSIRQLKDGHSGPFSLLMSKAMCQQEIPTGLRRADSLPNVFASIPTRESKNCERVR